MLRVKDVFAPRNDWELNFTVQDGPLFKKIN